jgi:hypothetical protein
MGGRPHPAKVHTLYFKDFQAIYPKWDEFTKLRMEHDPHRVFMAPQRIRDIFEPQDTMSK